MEYFYSIVNTGYIVLNKLLDKINYKNSINKDLIFINNVKDKYLFFPPANILMMAGNSISLDLFYCPIINKIV